MWRPRAPAPHHPRRVERGQEPAGNARSQGPERLRTTMNKKLTVAAKWSRHISHSELLSHSDAHRLLKLMGLKKQQLPVIIYMCTALKALC